MDIATYIEQFEVPEGDQQGERVKLYSWEQEIIDAIESGTETIGCTIAKGAGKSFFAAALIACALDPDGPLHAKGVRVQVSAGGLRLAAPMMDSLLALFSQKWEGMYRPAVSSPWRLFRTSGKMQLIHVPTDAQVEFMPALPSAYHGSRPKIVLLDECGYWPQQHAAAILELCKLGLGKIPGAFLLGVSTYSEDELNPWNRFLDPKAPGHAQKIIKYVGKPAKTLRTLLSWKNFERANPSLADRPSLKKTIARERREAKDSPAALQAIKALRLNMGNSITTVTNLVVGAPLWKACEREAVKHQGAPIWGVDLGGTTSMSTVTGYWPESRTLESHAWFPGIPNLADREKNDVVPKGTYRAMESRDEITVHPDSRLVLYGLMVRQAVNLFGYPSHVVADAWRMADLQQALIDEGIATEVVCQRTGFLDGAIDLGHFRKAVLTKKLFTPVSLLMRWSLKQARTIMDNQANEKLTGARQTQSGVSTTARYDAAAGGILAVGLAYRMDPHHADGHVRNTLPDINEWEPTVIH